MPTTADRSRRRLAVVAIAVCLALVGGVSAVWWTQSDSSSKSGPQAGASPSGVPSSKAVADAARQLAALPAVQLSVSYYSSQEDEPGTQAELTVNASGQASGTLKDPVTGDTELAWADGRLYLKGGGAFWGAQGPLYARDLSASGRWFAPEKRSGYYMLNNFGLDVGTLTPASLAAVVREVTEDSAVQTEDIGKFGGRAATSYTGEDWTVIVASDAPHDVLALGGVPGHTQPIKTAAWNPSGQAPATIAPVAPADYRPRAPGDDPDHFNQPYVVVSPKPATPAQASAVPPAVAAATTGASSAPGTEEPGDDASSGSAPAREEEGPDFQVDNLSPYLCETPTCQDTFAVRNVGGQAADATLFVADQSIGERSFPLGTVGPGETRQVSFSRQNIATGTGRTITFTGKAWVYSSVLYGPDPAVAQRLRARGLELDILSEIRGVGADLRPTAVNLLDQMTKDTAPADQGAVNAKALEALGRANDQGQLPLLGKIVDSGRLQNPGDLREIIPASDPVPDRRVMEQVAHLLQTDPTAKVWYDGPYIVNGKQYRADYIYTGTENGQPVQRAVQVKTVSVLGNLGSLMGHGAEQLNGERPGAGRNGVPEEAPPGFERVLQVYLEPAAGPRIFQDTQEELAEYISSRRMAQARKNLCKPGGERRVDRLVIINGTGVHQWTDLSALGVPC